MSFLISKNFMICFDFNLDLLRNNGAKNIFIPFDDIKILENIECMGNI